MKALAVSINKQIVVVGKDGRWREILILYQNQRQNFDAINYSTVMSQLARIRHMRKDHPLFGAFLLDLNRKLHAFGITWLGGVRSLSTIVHALAKMEMDPQHHSSAKHIMSFLTRIRTTEWLFDEGKPQEISNCVWACGKLDINAPTLFCMLHQRAEWLVHEGNPQDIANCAWACGRLGIESPKLFEMLDQHAEWLFEYGNQQDVTLCAWACGKLGIKAPNLFSMLDLHAEWLLTNGKPKEIANCVWACDTLGVEVPTLLKSAGQQAKWLMQYGRPQAR